MDLKALEQAPANDNYLLGRGAAWFAFAMTMALMMLDYIDRQIIVSLFPYLKAQWHLSDGQLGALVSIVSITVAVGALPVALFADRVSRVKSIVAMALAWSLATLSCMWARGYGALFAARALVGLGEAGYGSVGSALIVSHFPSRMRGALMAVFFACAAVGSVFGVMLGGMIASKWGWQAAFGVVGVPGFVLALVYLKVRDYPTVSLSPELDAKRRSIGEASAHVARLLVRAPTMLWVCIGGAAQLIVVSALWAWLPSFLNRVHGVAPAQAGVKAGLVVLCCAAGAVVWGAVADKAGARAPKRKLAVMAALCVVSMLVLVAAFALVANPGAQFAVIALGGFFATCTVGPVVAIVLDVTHPGVRSTGASVLALFQSLFGMATGPFLAGLLSDAWGLVPALTVMPLFALVAAGAFLLAARSYETDKARADQPLEGHADLPPAHAVVA